MNRKLGVRKAKYRVFLVDDHPIVRHGLTHLINREPDLMVCGDSEDGSKGLTAVGAAKPDVVVVDLTLKRSSGFSLIKNLNALNSKMPILVLSIHEESLYAERCLRAGAKGYLMKEEAMENVLFAIRRVLTGEVYLSESMQSKLFRTSGKRGENVVASPLERLSDRELEIFRLLGQGVGTRQIAKELHLSISTVESHRARIKEKLDVTSGTELLGTQLSGSKPKAWIDPLFLVSGMTKLSPDHGKSVRPTVAEPWSGGPSGADTRLQSHSITVERKHVTFDLKENSRGRFLRIIEEVSGRRNAIIIPLTGIDDFRDVLNEVIKFSKTLTPTI